jgi:hypothetical protein
MLPLGVSGDSVPPRTLVEPADTGRVRRAPRVALHTSDPTIESFEHHPTPYDQTSEERPATECAGCHIANVAKTDMTWIQFYPLLRDKKGY